MPIRVPRSRTWTLKLVVLLSGAGLFAAPALPAQPLEPVDRLPGGWEAKRVFDPFRNTSRCVVESGHQKIHDGYQETEVYLRVDDQVLLVVTESNLDLREADVGLQVDGQKLIRPDRLHLEQSAVFESGIGKITGQFKAGQVVTLSLRFWPTWPSKGLKVVRFSLIGFTRATQRLPAC